MYFYYISHKNDVKRKSNIYANSVKTKMSVFSNISKVILCTFIIIEYYNCKTFLQFVGWINLLKIIHF